MSGITVPFLDLTRQHAALKGDLLAATERVLAGSRFILGPEVESLERELAALSGATHGVGVASGTDALRLALEALELRPGDEVLTPAFSFIASSSTIAMTGARPVFVDIDPTTYAIEPALAARAVTPRTRALVAVHLYGLPAPMEPLVALARAHGLAVIEDAAQAIGASLDGRPVGGWGDVACLSFYPTKNLGACGDGGMLLTSRPDLAERLRRIRHHGDVARYRHVELGTCSRLDELQAAFLRVKLAHLDAWTARRRGIAARYRERFADLPLELPGEPHGSRHVYHQFAVRHPKRDAFAERLAAAGIGTAVHYPAAAPEQPLFAGTRGEWPEASRAAREVLSLPCYAEMRDDEVDAVARAVREACTRL
jgi:dTDP-4-amino-4,6-dideoxygalactose transaminase